MRPKQATISGTTGLFWISTAALKTGRVSPIRIIGEPAGLYSCNWRPIPALAGNAVDAGVGGRGDRFVPLLPKLFDKLRSNEPCTADYYDFYDGPFLQSGIS